MFDVAGQEAEMTVTTGTFTSSSTGSMFDFSGNSLTINGGKFTQNEPSDANPLLNFHGNALLGSTLEISGGTFYGGGDKSDRDGVIVKSAKSLDISGGTFSKFRYAVKSSAETSTINGDTGKTVEVSNNIYGITNVKGTMTISGNVNINNNYDGKDLKSSTDGYGIRNEDKMSVRDVTKAVKDNYYGLYNTGTLTVTDTDTTDDFVNNFYGVYNTGTVEKFSGNIVIDGSDVGEYGVYNTGSIKDFLGTDSVDDITIKGNSITGFVNKGSIETMENVTITKNGEKEDDALYSAQGGGLYNSGKITNIKDIVISFNTAAQGGGLYNSGKIGIDNYGFTNIDPDLIGNVQVYGNKAHQGGGVYWAEGSYLPTDMFTVHGLNGVRGIGSVQDDGQGGFDTDYANIANEGGGMYVEGGKVLFGKDNADGIVTADEEFFFINNIAQNIDRLEGDYHEGGALYIAGKGTVTAINTYFLANIATNRHVIDDSYDEYMYGITTGPGNERVLPTENGGRGGAVYNEGNFTIMAGEFAGNAALYANDAQFPNYEFFLETLAKGGAIYNAGTISVGNSYIHHNIVEHGFGGGIYNADGAKAEIFSSEDYDGSHWGSTGSNAMIIENNMALGVSDGTQYAGGGFGGGIYADSDSILTLDSVTVQNNTASLTVQQAGGTIRYEIGRGGGIYFGEASVYTQPAVGKGSFTIDGTVRDANKEANAEEFEASRRHSVINHNIAATGAGIFVNTKGNVTISNTDITDNRTPNETNDYKFFESTEEATKFFKEFMVTSEQSEYVRQNILFPSEAEITAAGHLFMTNGTGMFATGSGASYVLDNVTFRDNGKAVNDSANENTLGGALYVAGDFYSDNTVTMEIKDSSFTGNEAFRGAAIYAGEKAGVSVISGSISGNTAEEGGALYVAENGSAALSGVMIYENEAENGGAIYSLGTLTVNNIDPETGDLFSETARIYGNTANANGTIYIAGGTAEFDSVTIHDNSAVTHGSAFYVADGEVTLRNITIAYNGGNAESVIYAAGGMMDIIHTTIAVNDNAKGIQIEKGVDVVLKNSIVAGHNTNVDGYLSVNSMGNMVEDGVALDDIFKDVSVPVFEADGYVLKLWRNNANKALFAGVADHVIAKDQLGNDRSANYDGSFAAGAVFSVMETETLPSAIIVNTLTDDVISSNDLYSLREAFDYAAETRTVITVEFDNAAIRAEADDRFILESGIILNKGGVVLDTGDLAEYLGSAVTIMAAADMTGKAMFTFGENATVSMANADLYGNGKKGFILNDNSALTLDTVNVTGMSADNGSVADMTGTAALTVKNSTLAGNTATNGDIISNAGTGAITITDSVVNNNTATNGSLIDSNGAVTVAGTGVAGTGFAENDVTDSVISGADVTITNAVFDTNTAGDSIVNGADVTITGTDLVGNTATDSVITASGNVSVTDGHFENNTASKGAVIDAEGAISVNKATFDSNEAVNVLDAIKDVTVTKGQFTDNYVTESVIDGVTDVTITDSVFSENTAGNAVVETAGNITVSGTEFADNSAKHIVKGVNGVNGDKDIRIADSTFSRNDAGYAVVETAGDITVSGTEFADNSAEHIVNGDKDIRIADSTFTGNVATGAFIDAMGDVSVKNSTFDDNEAGNSLINGGVSDVTITDSSFTNSVVTGSLIETNGAVIVENSTLNSNKTDKIIDAHDAGSSVTVTNSTISNNDATSAVIYGNDKVFMDESSMINNKGTAAIQSAGNIAVISTTIADTTERTGTVKVDAGNNAYILNSTIADVSNNSGSLVEVGGTAYIHNSIVVSNDPDDAVVNGTLVEAYSVTNDNSSYNTAFGTDAPGKQVTMTANGMLVPVKELAERRGSFTMYSVNEDGTLNVSYSDVYSDELITTGNYYNPLVDQSWTVMTDNNAPVNGKVVRYTPGVQYFTMPGVGAYWSGNYSVDYGPGLNTDYFDPSFNGELDYYGKNNFRTTVSGLPAGLMDDDRRAMPSVDEFDSSINSGITSGFRVTERTDIGEMLTSEEYISETVNAPQDELDGEYYMTPTTADGVPVAPETAAEAEEAEEADALEETLAEITDSIGETVEKVASLFKHADVFKDDFDKALEDLLDIKA